VSASHAATISDRREATVPAAYKGQDTIMLRVRGSEDNTAGWATLIVTVQ
jgi:hypothetical protein